MARLKVEITPPENKDVDAVLDDVERKFAHRRATPEVIEEIEREAARLIRRLVKTKVTFVKD
ncbi:hypothetical protein [Atlantibacter hermannii]|uniref:hypothetical protein n=1 Tax=Atlantibacter hermannii TaxID=565 RepID=UPI0028A9BAB4|nr:hypothetical protein [Atlantibacter hermannii]